MSRIKTVVRGSHFDDVENHDFTLNQIGGMENLLEARAVMDALEPALRRCPFCGAPAVIKGIFAYSTPGAIVHCSQCKCSTEMKLSGMKLSGKNLKDGKKISLVVATAQAVHDWNHRAFDGSNIDAL